MTADMTPQPPNTGQPRPAATPLTRKLGQLVSLSAAEIAVLRDLQSVTRLVGRNREIVAEGANTTGCSF
jgi:hypothetical protein